MDMKKTSIVWFTKYLLDFMFYTGIAVCAGVPWLFQIAGKYFTAFRKFYVPYCVIFIFAGVFALIILWNLRKMFGSVIHEKPFVRDNVIALKRMGICAFVIAALMVIRLFLVITPAAFVLVAVFLIAGLSSMVLSQVFDQAVAYKQENDLTI
ncbi:MAG TPA: DUF2975 domain-containing protein [Lachnospiraceae bacterium]|jgi:ABC-type multidrug transport system fused ATPase/permease subunit|nr:DUF2975 domain-containing protein [Lachnospiraceae bacterium]HBY71063.1 DUF2975 domain-containing protein [Lachnospiraceae bacterium]HCA70740.1 DUF2975 domain-containing protein [Lachnospiraceae bacterium]HCM11863.1 DUF2975 domain-containing protein [Lachnospiraceae bacterium]HCR40427.1 DUF2975 domain-containing protein [Lachnospiraceae bacterium]